MALGNPRSAFREVRNAAQRPHALALAGLAALLWLLIALAVAAFLYDEHKQALKRATRAAEALVSVLEAHTLRTYQAVDITLAGLANTLRLAPKLQSNDPAFRQVLLDRLQALQPYGRGLFVVGADGRLLHDTGYRTPPDLSLADREYFRAHLEDPGLATTIWPPLRSRARTDWFIAITRGIDDIPPFRGVVVASVEPQYFQALFSRLGLGGADALALYHKDGSLIARHPPREGDVGKSFADMPLFREHLPRAASGTYITSSGVFSFERMVSYRTLRDTPLVVAMAQGTESILEPWRDTVLAAALALAALLLLMAALVAQFLRQQRVRDLARARSMQSEKLEALGHLTGGISHDFANLLGVVSASLRAITQDPADARRVREAAAVGERAIVRGSQLVEQLSAFARRQPLNVQPANLSVLVDSGLELLRHVTGRDMKLRVQLAPALAPCLLDETELEVALVNLLVNARDAGATRVVLKTFDCTDDNRPAAWNGQFAAQYVCLSVIDDGRGMAEQVRRRAFEPYFSTKGEKGTGLGLAQVYGFMRQIGGDVVVESEAGRGTTVHLLFRKATVAANAVSP